MPRISLLWMVILAAILAGIVYWVFAVNISAVNEPGKFETFVATHVKNWKIGRGAAHPLPAPPPKTKDNISEGSSIYGMACAVCHGQNGHNPTPIGRAMNPRVPDLSSPEVQGMSERELFWVIKNGVRLSGMPGFAKIEDDDQIWDIVFYVRSLRNGTVASH